MNQSRLLEFDSNFELNFKTIVMYNRLVIDFRIIQ